MTLQIRSAGQNLNYPVSRNEYIDHLRGIEDPAQFTNTLRLHKTNSKFACLRNVPNAGLPLTGAGIAQSATAIRKVEQESRTRNIP